MIDGIDTTHVLASIMDQSENTITDEQVARTLLYAASSLALLMESDSFAALGTIYGEGFYHGMTSAIQMLTDAHNMHCAPGLEITRDGQEENKGADSNG